MDLSPLAAWHMIAWLISQTACTDRYLLSTLLDCQNPPNKLRTPFTQLQTGNNDIAGTDTSHSTYRCRVTIVRPWAPSCQMSAVDPVTQLETQSLSLSKLETVWHNILHLNWCYPIEKHRICQSQQTRHECKGSLHLVCVAAMISINDLFSH